MTGRLQIFKVPLILPSPAVQTTFCFYRRCGGEKVAENYQVSSVSFSCFPSQRGTEQEMNWKSKARKNVLGGEGEENSCKLGVETGRELCYNESKLYMPSLDLGRNLQKQG